MYLPEVQWPFADGMLTLVIRANGDADALTSATRKTIWSVDRNQPILRIAPVCARAVAQPS